MRDRIKTPNGISVSYQKYGSGPSLVLVHGGFSDDETNWEFVKPMLEKCFTIYAIARRGRGETDATEDHSVQDEGSDLVALIESVGEPVFLLGHSYGAVCSLNAALRVPDLIRKLVLYEPPLPWLLSPERMAPLELLTAEGKWEDFAISFFCDVLSVPRSEIEAMRPTPVWPPILADAKASLGDLRALSRFDFQADRFCGLNMPVMLQTGSESPRDYWCTEALAPVLRDARIEVLEGQAHEGMTTSPEMYADSVIRFLRES